MCPDDKMIIFGGFCLVGLIGEQNSLFGLKKKKAQQQIGLLQIIHYLWILMFLSQHLNVITKVRPINNLNNHHKMPTHFVF